MVIGDLDVVCITVGEAEANAPLVIHGDRALPATVARESVQAVAARNSQIAQVTCKIDVLQPPYCPPNQLRWESRALA